jgi:inner membrane protein involved in colicin E2 resistance
MKTFTIKAAWLLALTSLLWLASLPAAGVVADRLHYRAQAEASIGASHAGEQLLVGPSLLYGLPGAPRGAARMLLDRHRIDHRLHGTLVLVGS